MGISTGGSLVVTYKLNLHRHTIMTHSNEGLRHNLRLRFNWFRNKYRKDTSIRLPQHPQADPSLATK